MRLHYINRFYLLLFFDARRKFERKFERNFEEESLKVTKVAKKNLFNENSCHRKFSKRKSVGYGTKVSKMFFLSSSFQRKF